MATLTGIIDGLEVRLATISGLRTYEYPADTISPPAAIVSLPETVAYDTVMARGADMWNMSVVVFVAKATDRAWRTKMATYLDGTGANSVKTAIEGDVTLGGAADTTRVISATPGIFTIGGVECWGATFDVEVIG